MIGSAAHVESPARAEICGKRHGWNPRDFAREQIRGLVRRVFFTNPADSARQVVFSAAEPGTDVGTICDQVGHALALETSAEIAILSQDSSAAESGPVVQDGCRRAETARIRSWSTPLATNLWLVPELGLRERCPEAATSRYWEWALAELRSDFEYVVIQGLGDGVSSESALLGQLTDGIILVLEANRSRRATTRKIKETLEGTRSRILGTVLSKRTFPVPEGIYRRL